MKHLLAISLLALLPPSLYAQAAHGFQPGQTISWQDRISGKWQSGTYIGATPGDRQPIIQQRPGEPGSQTAYEWDKISKTPPPAPGAAPAAGGKGMKPGQKIRWRDRITGQWQEGEFVGETPGGKQPIILQRPGEIGSQTAADWDDVQDGNAAAPANAPAIPPFPLPMNPNAPQPQANIPPLPLPANNNTPPQPQGNNVTPPGANGPPLMENDIKDWLAQKLPGNPFDDPEHMRQVHQELGELVKQRGTTFTDLKKLDALYPEGLLNHFGLTSTATGPLTHNYGPPNTKEQLFGKWETNKIGLPTHAVEGEYYVTTFEMSASKTGNVTINPDHTFVWETIGQPTMRGTWRDATHDEMADQGGAGVILQNAKNGVDWVAFKYRAGTKEEWLGLAEVNRRSVRESAARIQ